MSIHIMAMSDFRETLTILSFKAKMMSLKIWLFLRILSTSLDVICILVASNK